MALPEDLCEAAIKVARRLQSLTSDRFYIIILVKDKKDNWQLAVIADAKIEEASS